MAAVHEHIPNDEKDELDIMHISESLYTPVPAAKFLANNSSAPLERRTRGVRLNFAELGDSPRVGSKKRARRGSIENHDVGPVKRLKLEDKKAVSGKVFAKSSRELTYEQLTIVVNSKKTQIDTARRIWLHRHRHLFLPLVPAKSNFFDNLGKESKLDHSSYIPLHQFQDQPSLIYGGQMKDYQVRSLKFVR